MREDAAEREINYENGDQNFSNYDIDLQRAIEMSRMQYLAETSRSTAPIEDDRFKRFKQEEKDLQMAIQLSLLNEEAAVESLSQSSGATGNKPTLKPNTFGVIKDVNVTNLLFESSNKTNHFESKDLKIRPDDDLVLQYEREPSRLANEGGIGNLQLKDVITRLNSLTANSEEEPIESVLEVEQEDGPNAEKNNISYV